MSLLALTVAACGGAAPESAGGLATTPATVPPQTPALAICEVYRAAADDIREALGALLANAAGSGPSQDVLGPILSARSELGIIAAGLDGEERADVEALAEDIQLSNDGEGFHANLLTAWDTFYGKYAERCGQPVNQ
jgi:hypothetical protein